MYDTPHLLSLSTLTGSLAICCSCERQDETAPAEEKIVLKVAQNSSIEHPYQIGMEKLKETLENRTKGAMEVHIFPSGQLGGSEEQAVQGVNFGLIDATVVAAGNLAPFVPEMELFNLPFLFRDEEHFYRVLDGPVGQWLGRVIEQKTHTIFLGYWSFGTRNVWNAKRPILTPEDLKGLKIRVMGSPILLDSFNALGAQATNMSWGELYSALQQGVLDGAECGEVDLLLEKFYEVTKHVSLTNHLVGAAPVLFSKKRYDALPPSLQAAVLEAGRASVAAARAAERELSRRALVELEGKGIEFHRVDKEIFRAKVQPVYKKYADRVGGMTLIEQVMEQ
jgi:tripartite ATP-independent transporter DctP family solute receptor